MKFPKPKFNIRESIDKSDYKIMMVNTSLENYQYKSEFPWYLWIDIKNVDNNGNPTLPSKEQASQLNEFEDNLINELNKHVQSHFIGRVTSYGHRELFLYIDNAKEANDFLQNIISSKSYSKEFEYYIKSDVTWDLVDFFY